MIHPRATTEFIYRYHSHDTAQVYLSFKLGTNSRKQEVSELLETLEKQGMKGYDLSDDELAKSHSRYMIGGTQKVENERLFRFGACCLFQLPIFVRGDTAHQRIQTAYRERRVSRTAWSAQKVPVGYPNEMEYLVIPLSEPWRR